MHHENMAGTSSTINWKSLPWASLSLLIIRTHQLKIPKISPISHLLNSHFVIIRTLKSSKCPKQNYKTTALKSKSLLIKSPSSNKMASTKPLQSHHLSWKWKSSLKALLCPLDALCLPLAMISSGIKQNPLLVFSFSEGCRIISKFMGFCF